MGLGLVNLHDFHVGLIQATIQLGLFPFPSSEKDKGRTEERRRKRWDKESTWSRNHGM